MSLATSAAATRPTPWGAIPREVGVLLRPGLPALVDAVVAAVRAEVPEYDQPLEGAFGRVISAGVRDALEQFVALLDAGRGQPDLSTAEALGRGEHRAGRTLDALQSAYRTGARVSWRHVAEVGAAHGVDPEVLFRCAEAIFAFIDLFAAASVAGYAQAAAVSAGTLQARRQALIELLAAPEAPPGAEVERAAAEAGWVAPARVAAVAVGEADAVALARRGPEGAIGAVLPPGGLLLVPDPDGPGRAARLVAALRQRPAVLGPSVPWPDARHSVARAQAAWPLHAAGRLGPAGLTRADEHLLALLLHADPRVSADLVRRRLAPLDALTPGARGRAVATLQAWLDAHGDVAAAAEALHVHPQTVRYRLGGLRQALPGVLDDPQARLELALALRSARYTGSA